MTEGHARGRPLKIGLTGSIAMGKSTTARLFAEAGAAVFDADAAVHRLYAPGGAAAAALRDVAPEAVGADQGVDRAKLKAAIARDPILLARIEAAVHPLVAEARAEFEAAAAKEGAPLWVYDVPLLFETGQADRYDAVVVVSAAAAEQRRRAMARPGMTEADFERILARQTPDAEKRARADFVVETDHGVDDARRQVRAIVAQVTKLERAVDAARRRATEED